MRILVISAHPDDETIGCGGTLLKHRSKGDDLFWLIATAPFEPAWSAEIIAGKTVEVDKVAQAYGMERVFRMNKQATRLDAIPQNDLMTGIREAAEQVKPEWVYLVNRSDVHSDHRAVFEAAVAVFKPFHTGLGTKRILCYETQSSTDAAAPLLERAFIPNVFSNITSHIDRKLEILNLYQTEVQPYPLPRAPESIRAMARVRGATIGVEYAESFMLIRDIF